MTPKTKKTIRQAMAVAAVNAALIALGVLTIELAFGNWFTENKMNRLNIIRGRKLKYQLQNLYPCENQIVEYTRDHNGFRGKYPAPNQIDVLTVGGSTTDQRYVTDGRTWQDVIANKFRDEGRNAHVVNAGVDGQSTYGHLVNFEWWFPFVNELKPKFILFYIGVNDFAKKKDQELETLIKDKDPSKSIGQTIRENSAIINAMQKLKGIKEAAAAEHGHHTIHLDKLKWTTKPLRDDHHQIMNQNLLDYRRRVKMLAQKTRGMDATPIFVTQPMRRYKNNEQGQIIGVDREFNYFDKKINGVDFHHMNQLLNQATLDAAQEAGAIAFDLARDIQFQDDDFYDFEHNTPKGARKIGLYLQRKLKPLLQNTKTTKTKPKNQPQPQSQ